MTTPIARRPLTDTELGDVFAEIDAATTPTDTMARTIRAVYTALLDGVDRPGVGFGPGQHIDPNDFVIPDTQWRAIVAVATNRAEEWGSAAELTLDVLNYMPGTYDDPTVATPTPTLPDCRPLIHQLNVTRDAVDVIAANSRYLDDLAAAHGADSLAVRMATATWYRHLTDLLVTNAGGHAVVRADGQRSLHVTTATGFSYGIVFHPHPHPYPDQNGGPVSTTDPGTGGTAAATSHTTVDGHGVRLGRDADAPEPGVWVAHS
jgi:hypothetical protein